MTARTVRRGESGPANCGGHDMRLSETVGTCQPLETKRSSLQPIKKDQKADKKTAKEGVAF